MSAPDDVSVLVYISGGDDLNGFAPRYPDIEWIPNSGEEPIDVGKGRDDIPTADLRVKFRSSDAVSSVLIGEVCPSIRYLLKRYNFYTSINEPSNYSQAFTLDHGMYPFPPLLNPNINPDSYLHRSTDAFPGINYVSMTYFAYYRPAFLTVRGGMRWKFVPWWSLRGPGLCMANRVLTDSLHIGVETLTEPLDANSNVMAATTRQTYKNICAGAALNHSSVNGILEIEVPYHSQSKFYLGRNTDGCGQAQGYLFSGFTAYFKPGGMVNVFTAAAEDLTFGTFIGFPPYRVPVQPPPDPGT